MFTIVTSFLKPIWENIYPVIVNRKLRGNYCTSAWKNEAKSYKFQHSFSKKILLQCKDKHNVSEVGRQLKHYLRSNMLHLQDCLLSSWKGCTCHRDRPYSCYGAFGERGPMLTSSLSLMVGWEPVQLFPLSTVSINRGLGYYPRVMEIRGVQSSVRSSYTKWLRLWWCQPAWEMGHILFCFWALFMSSPGHWTNWPNVIDN